MLLGSLPDLAVVDGSFGKLGKRRIGGFLFFERKQRCEFWHTQLLRPGKTCRPARQTHHSQRVIQVDVSVGAYP